jgi:hypothetical protein
MNWNPVKYILVLVALWLGGLFAKPINAIRRALEG